MKLIVGLGNPGPQYEDTRHNIGFNIVEALAAKWKVSFKKSRFQALIAKSKYEGQDVLLVKPLTFMNLSGQALGPLVRYFKIDFEDVLVVHDELDFSLGRIKFQKGGSSGGHNGLSSIIDHAGTENFKRLRVGIGRPKGSKEVVDFVLTTFQKEEQPTVYEIVSLACHGLEASVVRDFNWVMNHYNSVSFQKFEAKTEN